MRLRIITVPYRYDEPREGLGLGPDALIDAGLSERLGVTGHEVTAPRAAELPADEREEGRTAVNIGKLGARTADLVAEARRDGAGALVLAGDDTACIGVVSGVQRADGPGARIGIVWFDAHGDFNTPETSFSGILAGMPLAVIAGLAGPNWRAEAGMGAPIPTERILLAGVRDLDEKEEALLRSTAVRVVPTAELREGDALDLMVERLASSCEVLVLHVDLDLLDPHLVPSASTPAANGLTVKEAASAIATALRTGKVATVSVTSLNPGGGQRGDVSIQSALELIEQSLVAWQKTPPSPAGPA